MIIDELDDDDYLRIGALPMVPFCEALLDRKPKASSADLQESWNAMHPPSDAEPEIPKAEFKRLRDAWKTKRTELGSVAEDAQSRAQQASDARAQVWAQLDVALQTNNTKKAAELSKMLKTLDAMAPERASAAGSDDDKWARLTDTERACMLALVAKMEGAPLEEDAEWFLVLLARVPDRPWEVHPAHLPLPEAPRPAMLTA